ncbi:TonB-dependent receptor-like protein [Jejuia pallidilutea]|uniref:TonB-dependent receptor-like protein n=2 Tax=Jejuia pallidilutea TaxID=504487 RepID=A0A362WZX3_9FLAO|nr:TonB-dependent receptor [Jejuia pallidilutea]PQV45073.1 TonB-dependent receptor-like protein [Jejuia pallidilutea]
MHPKLLCVSLLLLLSVVVTAQEKFAISGTVTDASNGETLFGASVFLEGTTSGAITNEYGFYSITAEAGDYNLIVSYVGYATVSKKISLNSNQKIDFEISEASTELDEVLVIAEESERLNIKSPQMSVSKLKLETIKNMPVVLGEVDIIKSIQLLPGVTSGAEGSAGFNVRGGAADQNLVLLDEAIIYNTSHLFGFFSVFNADAIKDVKLYKGGIPARFGGRVSSVLDVRQKDGNSKNFELNGGIGLISSRLSAEGPLFNDKGSFLVAGRGSYAHLFLQASGEENAAYFYDLNLKTNYNIDKNNKLYLSGYFGRDEFNFGANFNSGYGNTSGNLRWNHIFSDRVFSNLSFIYSDYDYVLDFKSFDFDWISEITNYNIKYDLSYYQSDRLQLDFGLNAIYYDFNPGEINPTSPNSSINPLVLDQKRAFENGLYASAEYEVSDKLTATIGLRYSYFIRNGGQPITEYENGLPIVYNETLGVYEEGNAIGETNYAKSETIKTYGNLEPRLALAYQLNENSSIKAGYSHTAQYIHLLSNTLSVTPLDVWTPSGSFIKPQLSDQYAIGYFKNFKNKSYSLEIETYYKTVANRIDYVDGSDLIGQNTIETEILNGELRAYGLEFLFRKAKGDFTGWLAYTISKAEQRTPGGAAGGPGINNGNWYYAPHDRTHDLSITGSYKLNDKWNFGANVIYQTGRPVTYPDGQYTYEGLNIANFSDRNASRLTDYHRIDVSATYVPNRKPEKRWKGEWVFGIYNIYNRRNAASISFGQNRETGANEATRTAIFGIVPSVSYNFKF